MYNYMILQNEHSKPVIFFFPKSLLFYIKLYFFNIIFVIL